MIQPETHIAPKQHFEILDGLRGIAAMMVVIFHLCETWNGGDHAKQIINHGYLAVDFSSCFLDLSSPTRTTIAGVRQMYGHV